jgi:hypothetical protein
MMKVIHPSLANSLPAVRVERIEDEALGEAFSLTTDGDEVGRLTALDPADEVELQPNTEAGATVTAEGCWRLDAVDSSGDPMNTQILFLPSQRRHGGTLSGELAAWATLALVWSSGIGPGRG